MRIKAFIKQQLTLLPAIVISMVIGAVSTTAVMAAIPDSNNVIHGCRSTLTGTLRVIDSEAGGTCSTGEAVINWNQTGVSGTQPVYYVTTVSGNVDMTRSSGVVSGTQSTTMPGYTCLDLSFVPKVAASSGTINIFLGISQPYRDTIDQNCPSGSRDALIYSAADEGHAIFL